MGGSLTMSFLKFSKGKVIYSVPNGLGDGSAYFNQTEGVVADLDVLPYGNSARSISLWCYWRELNPDNTSSTMFCYGSNGTSNRYTITIKTENYPYTIVVFAQGNTTTYNYALEFNKWYHIVVVFAEDYTEKCYVNGVLVGTQTHANVNTIKATGAIGRSSDTTTRNDWFYGNLKELNVYNRVLSADEVTALYNKQEITDGRVLHIPLQYGKDDESIFSSKSFVYDYSLIETSSGFNALGNPIRYRSASGAGVNYISPASVDFANSAYFDGGYAEVDHKGVIPLGNKSRTFSLWVKVQGTAGNGGFLWDFGKEGSGGTFFNCRCFSSGKIGIPNSGTSYWTASSSKITFNKWVHLTYTFDSVSGEVKFYIDSVLDKTFTDTYATTYTTLYIGGARGYWPNFSFSGNIVNFQVYDRALTQDEVTLLYNQKAVTKGLVLHVPLQSGKDDDSMFVAKNFTYGEV
jgi:hypothetical protein